MKLNYKSVDTFLKNPDAQYRAALVYGPDAGLVRERATLIRKAVLNDAADPFAFVELSESVLLADPVRLSDEVLSVGLLASKRLIHIRDAGDKVAKIVQEAAPSLHKDVFLLISAEELSSRSPLRLFFESDAACAALACYRDEIRDLQGLIQQTFSTAGIAADRDVVDFLAQQLGNDRSVTRQELEKIVTYCGSDKILSMEEARALVDYNRDTQADDLVHAAADKDIRTLEAALSANLRDGAQPVAYLRALQRYFNRLYYIKSCAAQGRSVDAVIAELKPKVFYKNVPVLTRHANHWSLEQLVKALKILIAAELACKTSDLPPVPASSRRLFQLTQIR